MVLLTFWVGNDACTLFFLQGLVDDAVSKGATVTTGGMRNKDHPDGLFYLPTVGAK